jgi:hypothetical protein
MLTTFTPDSFRAFLDEVVSETRIELAIEDGRPPLHYLDVPIQSVSASSRSPR